MSHDNLSEAQVCNLSIRNGWYSLKTDAALVTRGQSRSRVKHGTLPEGFPDRVFLLGLPGFRLGLATLIDLKTWPDQWDGSETTGDTFFLRSELLDAGHVPLLNI